VTPDPAFRATLEMPLDPRRLPREVIGLQAGVVPASDRGAAY
jgi:hypothetical protein